MMIKKIIICTCSILILQYVYCQNEISFGFKYDGSCVVKDLSNVPLEYAWAGGLTSAQFCELDLNLDGINDLIIFDKISNKLLFFVASFENNSLSYTFSPEYFKYFPEINHWMICKDYDKDGKADIFTYTIGGIKVYKNVSNTELEFKQVTSPFIKSYYNQIHTNILATSVDYPAIEDIDGDGDLDILVFSALGTYVEFHKNYSMEEYNSPDSLLFYKESDCWGRFAESDESNVITLNTCAGEYDNESKEPKHTGSTFFLFDADNDGLLDLLLGDVDYPAPCLLYNKGSVDEALITDYTFSYPESYPIKLFSFPVMNYLDVDKDGKNELIISTFDPAYNKIENTNSVWLYKNNGEINSPNFVLETKSFLQNQMIYHGTGAYPLLFDYDNDGDLDLFVGNWGYWNDCSYDAYMNLNCDYTSQIAYFENVGNNNSPEFILRNDDFANLSMYDLRGLYPSFFDFDNDGDPDLICGHSAGSLILFENVGNDTFGILNSNWLNQNTTNINYSTPCFYDFNNDGYQDIVVGNEKGTIYYYENDKKGNFELKTDFFGKISVRDSLLSWTGYSTPCAYRFNDTTYLFVGSETGKIFCYYDIDNNLQGKFKEKILSLENLGSRTSPAIANIKGDSFPELLTGNFSGGLLFFEGVKSTPAGINHVAEIDIKIYPNPTTGELRVECGELKVDKIEIFDNYGKKIKDMSVSTNLNISNLSTGIYNFRITTEEGAVVKRVVKL